jgi:hypothetical protein
MMRDIPEEDQYGLTGIFLVDFWGRWEINNECACTVLCCSVTVHRQRRQGEMDNTSKEEEEVEEENPQHFFSLPFSTPLGLEAMGSGGSGVQGPLKSRGSD